MRQLINYIKRELQACVEDDELATITKALCCEGLGIEEYAWYLRDPVSLTDNQVALLGQAITRLKGGEPLQYVLGTAPFAGLTFNVDSHVLIPRPETAGLVQFVAEERPSRILDMGTGSGCIAIALAHRLPTAEVYACDLSNEALHVAANNAADNQVHITFTPCNLLDADAASTLPKGCDCLVSNPPYIRRVERHFMEERVTGWEPSLALFVPDDDPLLFYRAIARIGQTDVLRPGGQIAVEINQLFGAETCILFSLYGYEEVRLRFDLFGQPRYVTCRKPTSSEPQP